MWNFGHEPSQLANNVNKCPPFVLAATRRLLNAMQRVGQVATRRLALGAAATGPAAVEAAGVSGSKGCAYGSLSGEEEAMWELETELGLVRTDFDAETQLRTRMVANSRAAQIWGYHREEYLARFAAHESPCPFSGVAALCNFLFDINASRTDRFVAYQRFSFGAGPSTRALLVRTCKTRVFDGLGRMVQVSCAARKRPWWLSASVPGARSSVFLPCVACRIMPAIASGAAAHAPWQSRRLIHRSVRCPLCSHYSQL